MDLIDIAVLSVFFALFLVGSIGVYLSSRIIRGLIKHREDNAPLTLFMLRPDESKKEIKMFIYPSIMLLLTGIFTLAQKLIGPISFTNIYVALTYLLAYLFGIITAVLVVYVIYRWYNKMRRFL